MSVWRKLLATPYDPLLTFLRFALFAVFFPHGAQKVLGWFGGPGFYDSMEFFTRTMGISGLLGFLAITAEFAGAIVLLLGFCTRVAAFGLACVMVVAITTTHWQNGLFMIWAGNQAGEGFEFHLLALALLGALMIRGAGALSLDRKILQATEGAFSSEGPIGLRQSA